MRLLLVLAAVIAIRVPFLDHAIQGDDAFYLAIAQNALVNPLHPSRFEHIADGMLVDMSGFPHPPGNAWILAGLLRIFGDVYEPTYHSAYVVFSLLAAGAMWSLARRFSTEPLWATALFLATPSFVINGNSLESDLPLLAFWLLAVAFWVHAVDLGSAKWLALSITAMGCAAMIAYQSVVLTPVVAGYVWIRRRGWKTAWLAAASPVMVVAAWQLFERVQTGAMPSQVMAGYFSSLDLQAPTRKLRNAAALTVHLGWMIFPLLALAARSVPVLIAGALAAAVGALFIDAHPLFWAPFGAGVATLVGLVWERPEAFPRWWIGVFFCAALAIFFAGSARYLLPIAAPLAILTAERLRRRTALLAAGVSCQLALSLTLAAANYQHWDLYRQFVRDHRDQMRSAWIGAEWGLRFYAEAEGARVPLREQPVRHGDGWVTSLLSDSAQAPSGGAAALVSSVAIKPSLPLRLLGAESAYSSAQHGLRAFDLTAEPADTLRLAKVSVHEPTLSWFSSGAEGAASHILSGVYPPEGGGWRWTASRAVVRLRRPQKPSLVAARFRLTDHARGRTITLAVDGVVVATQSNAQAGLHELRAGKIPFGGETATVTLALDRGFRVPGDGRELGVILTGIGFDPK